jgi:hypothetical protein
VYYTNVNNVFSFYIQKSEGYDDIEICNIQKGHYMDATKITWKNQTVASLPSGYIQVTMATLDALAAYPVGSIYLTVNDVNPQTLFGGSWEKLKGGLLYGAEGTGTKGDNGNGTGTSTGATALSTSQIPAHTHGNKSLVAKFRTRAMTSEANIMDVATGNVIGQYIQDGGGANWGAAINYTGSKNYATDAINIDASHTHDSVGGGAGHTHTIPYIAVYIWKRTG